MLQRVLTITTDESCTPVLELVDKFLGAIVLEPCWTSRGKILEKLRVIYPSGIVQVFLRKYFRV